MPNVTVWSDDFISVNLSSDSNSTFPEISTALDGAAPPQNSSSMKLLFLLLLVLIILGLIIASRLMARRFNKNSQWHHLEEDNNDQTTTSHREINMTSPPDETDEKPINVEQPKTYNLTPLQSAAHWAQEPQNAEITLSTVVSTANSLIPHNSHTQPADFENKPQRSGE